LAIETNTTGMARTYSDYKIQFRRKDTRETIEEYISRPKGESLSKREAMRDVLNRPGYMMLTESDVEALRLNKVDEHNKPTGGVVDESVFGF